MSDDGLADDGRVRPLLESLERLAGGDLEHTIAISPAHDVLDAIAFGINVLVGELRYASDDLVRARDDAERANKAKTAFLRNVSHEIRTPLTAILSLSELLARPDVDPARTSDLAERIRSNAGALLSLVDELLDLSKVEAGKLPFEIVPMSPLETAVEVVRALEVGAEHKQIEFVVEATAGTPVQIHSDQRRVRQILMNVIGNALKFTERGEIRVRLAPDGAARLVIDVSDTGIGLSAEQQQALFMPFQQGTPTTAEHYGGSGLGLMLSKRFAEALGGDVVIAASAPGIGTTLRLTLRTDLEVTERATRPAAPAPPRPARPLVGRRLLLAEDSPDIRMALAELLEFAGASVAQAEDGYGAVSAVLGGSFDAVLMDVRMPGIDGLQATRQLREKGCRLPIVALTADAMKEHRADCLAAGYDDYVVKPIEYTDLVETVLRVTRAPARPA